VIDLDIRKFFDSVPWNLVVTAVEANTDLPWVVLYVMNPAGTAPR
jgi:RNA-directed DNA polymerase